MLDNSLTGDFMQKFVAALMAAGVLGGCAMALPAPVTPTPN